jgi:outer membrane protein OmpA-like peptidoglycan-associated protein
MPDPVKARPPETPRRLLSLTAGFLMAGLSSTLLTSPAWSQETVTSEAIATTLSGLETPSDLEVAVLRQQATDRIKAKADGIALKRRPLSPQLARLPHVNADIQFNPDTPVIRPESYRTLGLIAEALSSPPLLSFTFLVVGRTEATGRRENNLALSHRRAEAVRDVLVTTFRISSKRVLAVGLGEEQLQDANNPRAAVNQQTQIVTLHEVVQVAGAGSTKPPETGHTKPKAARHGGK